MIRVLVLGDPFNASRIARSLTSRATDLRAADIRATYVPHRSYLRLLALPPRSERVVLVRAGYRVGATTPRGRLFDAYWSLLRRTLPNAAPCHYWLGTDVLETVKETDAGTIRIAAVSSARDDLHLTVAPWLTAELESVGIAATTVLLPPPHPAPEVAPPLPSEFRVLAFLPANRFAFYGGDTVVETARRLPDVRFDVVGSVGEQTRSAPANVRWHGRVSDMPLRYAETSVVVRVPRHDGFANVVIEGLLNARHVICTHEIPFTHRIWPVTAEALAASLVALRDAHTSGGLSPNLAGRSYALEEFDEADLMDRLIALMRGLV
jgi:hypothetical protein